jgi:hypothetical protein
LLPPCIFIKKRASSYSSMLSLSARVRRHSYTTHYSAIPAEPPSPVIIG